MARTNGMDATTTTATAHPQEQEHSTTTNSSKPAPAAGERIDLFAYTEEELLQDNALTYYQILNVPEYASQDAIKKAYRRTSLRYHPDKSGRGEEDYVFLAVKQAYDTLLDHAKRQAYDSTVVPFDDHIPPNRAALLQDPLLLYKDDDFYETFEPVFLRNLRFDLGLRPDLNKKNARTTNNNGNKTQPPPSLGTADTPMDQVHAFYEYWIHFESWRDFSATAAEELQVSEHELENAESRHEKRWYQNQIDKRAKQLKRQEMSRISTLVERAMEADPRLRQERAEKVRQKEEAAAERQRLKDLEQTQRLQELERQQELEKQQAELAALEKVEREKDKKVLRKARQQLRKMASASFESHSSSNNPESPSSSPSPPSCNSNGNDKNGDNSLLWDDAYDMQQDVEFLCANLSLNELHELSQKVVQAQQSASGDCLKLIHERAILARQQQQQAEELLQQTAATLSEDQLKSNASNSNRSRPWTREELSALAKAVKKYPPGGASRWDQISLWVNNLCRQANPRTKEECIEQYNLVARGGGGGSVGNNNKNNSNNNGTSSSEPVTTTSGDSTTATAAATTDNPGGGDSNTDHTSADVWTQAQDQQLQDALAQFPATMDKNERWSSIAAAVPGKSKKQCVARFKAIRGALKKNKE